MARKRSKYPTELELEILKVLWEESPVSVRRVREAMEVPGAGVGAHVVDHHIERDVQEGVCEAVEGGSARV